MNTKFSEARIRKVLIEMATKALALGMNNGEIIIAIEEPGEDFKQYSRTVGRINRGPKNGDLGRNYSDTAAMKLAFSRRTKLPSGKYTDLQPMLGEIDFAGCIPVAIESGWVYFACSGLVDDKDDELVCETGRRKAAHEMQI